MCSGFQVLLPMHYFYIMSWIFFSLLLLFPSSVLHADSLSPALPCHYFSFHTTGILRQEWNLLNVFSTIKRKEQLQGKTSSKCAGVGCSILSTNKISGELPSYEILASFYCWLVFQNFTTYPDVGRFTWERSQDNPPNHRGPLISQWNDCFNMQLLYAPPTTPTP